jgi:8-oxo-dGTP diphosphatase
MTDDRTDRQYPARPMVGVGAVVIDSAGAVVLVRRKYPPLKGRWTLPGGMIELRESARDAVRREVLEETGLSVEVGEVIEAVDHIEMDAEGRTSYHFVIIDYLCRSVGGVLQAGTDVEDVCLASPAALEGYDLTERSHAVIRRAIELYTQAGRFS